MEKENCLNKRMYDISKYAEIAEIVLISLGIFLIPMIIPQLLIKIFGAASAITNNAQLVVGTIVNCSLILAGVNVKGWKKLIGLITLPSISAIFSGLIFQTASYHILSMIPAIWIGNFTLIYIYKKLHIEKKKNYLLSTIVGIVFKVIIIFIGFNFLLTINIIPKGSPIATILISAMGIYQLITAALGSILAFIIIKIVYVKRTNSSFNS